MQDLKLTNSPVDRAGQRARHIQCFLHTSAHYLGLIEAKGRVQISRQKPVVGMPRPGTASVFADQYTGQPENAL
jgi:hypothetical protein